METKKSNTYIMRTYGIGSTAWDGRKCGGRMKWIEYLRVPYTMNLKLHKNGFQRPKKHIGPIEWNSVTQNFMMYRTLNTNLFAGSTSACDENSSLDNPPYWLEREKYKANITEARTKAREWTENRWPNLWLVTNRQCLLGTFVSKLSISVYKCL